MEQPRKRTKVGELDVSQRCLNVLWNNNIVYVDQLVKMTKEDVVGLKGIAPRTITEITELVQEMKEHDVDNPLFTLEEIAFKELQEKKRAYVKEQADNIINGMLKRHCISDTLATCDHSNWDRELHRLMPYIVTELKSRGIEVVSSVNHGVTDWVFTIK